MSNRIIPTGPYFGFTEAELLGELARVKSQRKSLSALLGASVNGQSFNREGGSAQLVTLAQQTDDLQHALHWMRPDLYPIAPSNRARIRFV